MDQDAFFGPTVDDLARQLEDPDWEPRIRPQPYRPARRRRWRGL